MALPLDNRQIDDIASTTLDYRRQDLIDSVFKSRPLFNHLMSKNRVVVDGGDKIRQPILYDKLPSGWYSGTGPFNTDSKETETDMVFEWKAHYVNITIPGISVARNSGAAKVRDLVTSKMKTASMTGADDIAGELFNNGTDSDKIIGLQAAIATTGSYGTITRDTSAQGTAVKGVLDTTGGAFSLPFMNEKYGGGIIADEHADLIVTTQTIWDKWWAQAQPQQRFDAGQGEGAHIGFPWIRFNGAMVVVDSKCPSGHVYFLNTSWILLIFHRDRVFTPKTKEWQWPLNGDSMTKQLLSLLCMVVQAPRLQSLVTNVT
jgi:hypothetical protein